MKPSAPAILVPCLMLLSGCGAGSFLNSLSSTPDLSGNWEIASTAGATSGTLPTAGLLLLGSLTSQGSDVSGIFRLANLSLPNSCGVPLQQVITVAGSIDSSRNLKLTSATFAGSTLTMQFAVAPTLSPVGAGATLTGLAGTVAITGGTCVFPSTTAFGTEVVSLTGTYAGPLAANPYLPLPPSRPAPQASCSPRPHRRNPTGNFPYPERWDLQVVDAQVPCPSAARSAERN